LQLFGGTASFCGLKEMGYASALRARDVQKEAGEPKPGQGISLDFREGAALGVAGFPRWDGSRKATGLKPGKGCFFPTHLDY
jgi:hypothetical protein